MSTPTDYERGLADGRKERAAEVQKLADALNKAISENLTLRSKTFTHLDAVSRQGYHASVARPID
ncbi:hypothetical protein OKA04_12215 [Luteolibacter flavescens]|uniref:Uncharacterized protein n=1 Tax=Luteolibacter flavescens TaxID=1859460 RepID=A0ABT3FPJ5_9BACT|nr:hypothetical protein [Luteolibacter flavescens]MCW1885495.1 hypothetical protein [Luteolibacter flavescens]